jgi:hypothetical protein
MAKERSSVPQQNSWVSSKKKLITISIILISVIVLAPILYMQFAKTSNIPFSLNAAIVDQLGKEFPNPSFVKNATEILETEGFNVTYYNQTIDVNFYRGLAEGNYGIIILRAHSALREGNSTVDLFTSEEFNDSVPAQYLAELESQPPLLVRGEFLYRPGTYYFAITSAFIEDLQGVFPKSVVIAMGCWSLKPGLEQTMPKAFIDKGARAYIGWTDLVLPNDTDNETLRLLRMFLNENKTLAEATFQTHKYLYKSGNTTILSRMNFYPESASNLKISELITKARTTSALIAFDSATVTFYIRKKEGDGLESYNLRKSHKDVQ